MQQTMKSNITYRLLLNIIELVGINAGKLSHTQSILNHRIGQIILYPLLSPPSVKYYFFRFNIGRVSVKSSMSRIRSKYHKIFNSIIIFNFVDVVGRFFNCKKSPQMFFYDKTTFFNITIAISFWMKTLKNHNISFIIYFYSTPPIRIIFTQNIGPRPYGLPI